MKWRKLIELSTSSSPPKFSSRSTQPTRRRATFEALENRKLFAVDLAEFEVAEFSMAELFSSEVLPIEDIEIRMMTFRGSDVVDGVEPAKSEEVLDGSELDSPIMTMTGAVDGFENLDVRTLEGDVDLSVTSYLVDDVVVVDDVISDEDWVFYSLGSEPEVETSHIEESLPTEDVNGDGSVTALDMLLVINALNSYGAMPSSQMAEVTEVASAGGNWDVNRDGYVTALDALLLTNYFNNSGPAAALESSQDAALVAPIIVRVREPVDDETGDEPVDAALDSELS